ncbi:MAG: gliding motility protein GldN [Muribaculaceae bacterium]|nr:gliding motility protein GldN [Muribaculaceae bacterium]
MKSRKVITLITPIILTFTLMGQVESAGVVKKRVSGEKKETPANTELSGKMQTIYGTKLASDADISYQKRVYRKLDLNKEKNAALNFPEEVTDNQGNLMSILYNLVVEGKVPAYEYLDGREIFTDDYKINVSDMKERFELGDEVPSSQISAYYIIENWEFDNRSNAMTTSLEALCPIIERYSDFGDRLPYPMFWIRYADIRPFLMNVFVAADDENDLQKYSLNDYFTLRLYDGEIYKTKNNRNLTLAQMYPDEDDLKHAQDSIDAKLINYGKDQWVPTREEYLAGKEESRKFQQKETVVDSAKEIPERKSVSSRSKKKSTKKIKNLNSNSVNSAAEKSVRRRKK